MANRPLEIFLGRLRRIADRAGAGGLTDAQLLERFVAGRDEDVQRLPDKYRVPFLLSYLEGRSNEEVARELGCPKGTVASRLARAREKLRARLARRGVTLSAGALAAALAEGVGATTVPVP